MLDVDDTRSLPEIAADMSAWATAEPWYGVYVRPQASDPLQVDRLVCIFREFDAAVSWLERHTAGRFYGMAVHVDELPAYRVPTACEETGL